MRKNLTSGMPCSPGGLDLFISQPSERVLKTLSGIDGDVMILGAGGKMGLHMSLMLKLGFERLGRSNRVIAVSRFRTLNDRETFASHGIETIGGDLSEEPFLNDLPSTPEVIFMAGAKFGTADQPGLLWQMNQELPRKVARRFAKSRIAVFSTGCVYAFAAPESGGSREDSPLEPVGEYARSCLAREEEFKAGSLEFGTKAVLLRLNYSNEFRYGVLVDICNKVLNGEPVDVTMGYVNVIWQGDAVQHLISSIPLASSPARAINITGAQILRVRDLAVRFGELLGREPVITGAEEDTAWISNPSASHTILGAPKTSVDEMMEWIAGWLQNSGATHGKPTGFERRDGRF